jgi:hypothetical protein
MFTIGIMFAVLFASWWLGFRRNIKRAGPRASTGWGDIPSDARRDKNPGDLVNQGIGGAMVVALPVLSTKSKKDISHAGVIKNI